MVLLGRLDGKLEGWNLLERTHAPVLVAPISPAAILALDFSPGPAGEASRSSSHLVSPPQTVACWVAGAGTCWALPAVWQAEAACKACHVRCSAMLLLAGAGGGGCGGGAACG